MGKGQYQTDNDSGLMLLGHRYYDASVGRFISSDPAKAGDNWYAYCDNNPLAQTDPLGLDPPKKKPLPPWQQQYPNKDAAAGAILRWIHNDPKAYDPKKEWGGWIHQHGKKFQPDPPRTDGPGTSFNPGHRPKDGSGDFHTHSPGSGYPNIFSGENGHYGPGGSNDLTAISGTALNQQILDPELGGYSGYVGTPKEIRVFTPIPGDKSIPDHPNIRTIKY